MQITPSFANFDARLAHRLATQRSGGASRMRRFILREAKLGRISIPSGAGRQITITASI